MKEDKLNKILSIILVAFVLLSFAELLFPNLIYGHDISFHMARITALKDSIKLGNIPSLIYPYYANGYGYANGIFYPHLFLYIPAILNASGLSLVSSYKIFLIVITISLVASMYFSTYKITKNKYASTITSIIYLMSSYRITDMYLRSALGETLTFIFFPIFMLGIYKIFYENEKEWQYFTIGLIGIVFSHVISIIFCLILTIIFAIINIKKIFKERKRLLSLLIAGTLGVLITLIFTLPMIEGMLSNTFEYQNIYEKSMVETNASNPLFVLFEIPSGKLPWQPPGIGIIFLFLFAYFYKEKSNDKFKKNCLILGIILLIVSTSIVPWKYLNKIFGIIQFPWRLFILVTLLLIFGFAKSIANIPSEKKKKFLIITSFISLFTYGIMTAYHYRFDFITEFKPYFISHAEYIPSGVDLDAIKERGEIITSNNKDIIISYQKEGTKINIEYNNNIKKETYIDLPLIYYKGYKAKDNNNNNLLVVASEEGLVRVYLNDNIEGKINVYYGFTTIRKISTIVSIISSIAFIGILINKKRLNN